MFGPLRDVPKELLNFVGGLIALAQVGLLSFIAYAFIYVPIPASNREPLVLLVGYVAANVGAIIGFFFGTSYGSQKKTEAIEKLTRGP